MNKKLLITGGAGFIGSNFVHYILQNHPDYDIIVLDKLTYAGNLNNLKAVTDKIKFIRGDICNTKDVEMAMEGVDFVVSFAAETHVDRSISGAKEFVMTEVFGANTLLEVVNRFGTKKFVLVSTDEVYGEIEKGSFNETDPLHPRNPYAATKAGADLLALSFFETYGLPVMITRTTNNFGPYQHPEKFIPRALTSVMSGKPIQIYGDGKQIRDWIFVKDNCAAIDTVLQKGNVGEVYNICAKNEKTNIEIATKVLQLLGKPVDSLKFVPDRPGHDKRYSLDPSKIHALGWTCKETFDSGMKNTVDWYKENEWWWKPLIENMG
ncbi:MAG: dTDP-glucose 4,6-dehydratase [Candidatus Aenigmarchaeota archaeon]|nr:dTDP-glucose 4,6-dehydratase [Candidatus Aenigmarchaeota archaeon]